LKYVRFREVEKINPDQHKRVEFKLMKRKMGTALALPKSTKINNILRMPRPNQTDLLPFAKLFYASSSYIKNDIILPAYRDLQEYLHEVEAEEQAARLSNIIIVSEIPYIQMAIKNVVEESKIFPDINIEDALKLLSNEEKKEIFKDTYASKIAGKPNESIAESKDKSKPDETIENKKPEIKQWSKEMDLEVKKYQEKKLKEGGFEPVFSDDEDDNTTKEKSTKKNSTNNFDGEFILNNNNFYQSCSEESLNEINQKKNEHKEGKNIEEEQEKSTLTQVIHTENGNNKNSGENSDNIYYFYQMADGQHYYLHPLCNKILKYEYGDYSNFPETIDCRIISLEESTINEDMRKRFKYLSHLPLTCDIVLCEIYLSDIVSSATFKKFKPEITQLSKKRQQKLAKEKSKNKDNNLKSEWMNLYRSIESSSTVETNKSQPLLYEPVNDSLLYSGDNKKKNDSNSQDLLPAALSQEAIDFLKNEQKKKAANSFAKIASSSSSNVTFSPWQGNKSTSKKKSLMVNGNEWVVNKDSGWSLDFDELVDDDDNESKKQKELTISDIINSSKNKNKGKGKEKDKDKDNKKMKNSEQQPSTTDEKSSAEEVNLESTNKNIEDNNKEEEIPTTAHESSKNNGKLGKKKSKKVIMISNGGQRRRY